MRRSILLTVLALGAQAAWAQDTTEAPDDEIVVEETSEAVESTTDASDETEAMEDETEVVEDDVVEEEDEVVEDETGGVEDETEVVEDDVAADEDEAVEDETGVADDETEVSDGDLVQSDNRSARGAFRGGHHGQVSTLARAGLGSVFGKLRSQGYGDIAIEQVGNEISISAARAGETRQLVYDASTGALLSDVSGPSSGGILQGLSSKLKKQSAVSSNRERKGSDSSGGGNDRGSGKDRRSGKGDGSGKGRDKGGNGKGKGEGKTNGRNR